MPLGHGVGLLSMICLRKRGQNLVSFGDQGLSSRCSSAIQVDEGTIAATVGCIAPLT
jgi:hypothetical protein